MKKFLSLILALILIMSMTLGMVSCDTTDDPSDSTQQTEVTELEEAKVAAKTELESYVNAENYREAEKTLLETTITNGKTAIDAAITVTDVTASLNSAKILIDAIKTDATMTAEELVAVKNTAKTVLEGYVNADNYRDAQKAELATAIANGKTAIDNAIDITAVSTALSDAQKIIDTIKTNAQFTAEELLAAKNTAKAELDVYANAANYRTEQQTVLATAIADGKVTIDASVDVAAVNTALANAKAVIDGIKTVAELTAEELVAAKVAAKTMLDSYKNANDYREAQKTELQSTITNGKNAIDNATDKAGVEAALANAKTAIDAIETDAEITAKEPTIWTDVSNGNVYTTTNVNINVIATGADGVKLSKDYVTVTVNDTPASLLWDDLNLTSFKLVLTEGTNLIKITATDGSYSKTEAFTVTCDPEVASSIVISIEAFSIGMGYVVEPYKITLDNATLSAMATYFALPSAEAMKAQLNGAFLLEYVIHLHGYTSMYTGAIESGYYLASISGVDTSNATITEEMEGKLNEKGMAVENYEVYEDGTLSQMDFVQLSGWMYGANGVALNVGFDQYIPQNGDVVRVQFTLAWGMDVGLQGGLGMGDIGSFYPEVNKDELTSLIAEALLRGVDATEEMEAACLLDTDQETIDAACESLREKLQ